MKIIITFTFCCDNLWKSKFMALEKPGKLREFFSPTLWPPCCYVKRLLMWIVACLYVFVVVIFRNNWHLPLFYYRLLIFLLWFVLQLIQISINMEYLDQSCIYLEDFISSLTG